MPHRKPGHAAGLEKPLRREERIHWIHLWAGANPRIECERCGGSESVRFPLRQEMARSLGDRFYRRHGRCRHDQVVAQAEKGGQLELPF